jgi:hypothetical protein
MAFDLAGSLSAALTVEEALVTYCCVHQSINCVYGRKEVVRNKKMSEEMDVKKNVSN